MGVSCPVCGFQARTVVGLAQHVYRRHPWLYQRVPASNSRKENFLEASKRVLEKLRVKAEILRLHRMGYGHKRIAKKLGVGCSLVRYTIRYPPKVIPHA